MTSVVLFSSCQKDEDKIIGTWNVDLYRSTLDGYPFNSDILDVSRCQFTFYEDGTVVEYRREEGYDRSYTDRYRIDDDKLIFMYYGEDEERFTIEELSKEKLIITSLEFEKGRLHYEMNRL